MLLVSFFQLNESTMFLWKNGSMDNFQAVLAEIFAVQPEGRKDHGAKQNLGTPRMGTPTPAFTVELSQRCFVLSCFVQTVNPRGKSQPGELELWPLSAGWVIPGAEGEHRNAVGCVGAGEWEGNRKGHFPRWDVGLQLSLHSSTG